MHTGLYYLHATLILAYFHASIVKPRQFHVYLVLGKKLPSLQKNKSLIFSHCGDK